MTFAADTKVPVEKSRAEIDALLSKHGATQRGFMADEEACVARVFFTLQKRQIRLEVPLPKPDERAFTHDHNGWRRREALQVACVAMRIYEEGDPEFDNMTDEEAQP
jgi:hypothetical protein